MKDSCHEELASGTFAQANAEALMMKSFTDSFTFSLASSSFNSFLNLQDGYMGHAMSSQQTLM